MKNYDIIVIGSGPGGYVSAIRCAQLGFKTAIIEKYQTLGGTCLNVGCIPSKALLDSSEHFFNAKKHFSDHGINVSQLSVDIKTMVERKNSVVSQNCEGVKYLMEKNKIDIFHGIGSFKTKNILSITKNKKTEDIEFKNAIIATGSKPAILPFLSIDKKRIITSTEALNLPEIPKHFIVIGGGVIGLELGSVYARLGSKVSVIEYSDSIISMMDKSLSKELQKILKKKLNIEFYTNHKVTKAENNGKNVTLHCDNKNGEKVEIIGDYCLVSIGRKPYTENLGLENIGLKTNGRGEIDVNHNMQTLIPNIFAIGDVVKGPMLAHKAEEEGIYVAEFLAGQKPHINYNLIPGVIYTWPEVASVGKTEEELKSEGKSLKIGSFPFKALGRARASMDTEGFIKIISDSKTDEILGVHMIGARVADIISEAVVAMEYRASAEDISRICHAHPTFTEAFKEACLDATDKRAIHI